LTTCLVKDFTLNYLGRSAYHFVNGNLIKALQEVTNAFPSNDDSITEAVARKIHGRIWAVCTEGKKVFQKGGALHNMLDELDALLVIPSLATPLMKSLASIKVGRSAFDYFSGASAGVVSNEEL